MFHKNPPTYNTRKSEAEGRLTYPHGWHISSAGDYDDDEDDDDDTLSPLNRWV